MEYPDVLLVAIGSFAFGVLVTLLFIGAEIEREKRER